MTEPILSFEEWLKELRSYRFKLPHQEELRLAFTQHKPHIDALEAENKRLREALQSLVENKGCADPDCCDVAIAQTKAIDAAKTLLNAPRTL